MSNVRLDPQYFLQFYARVTMKDLNKVYHQTHPAALNKEELPKIGGQ
jgi:hypothetical protein